MAIDFSYDQRTDLALFTLAGPFDLEEWLQSAETGRFTPAFFEIVDMRRCDLNAMRSMDLCLKADRARCWEEDRYRQARPQLVSQ